MDWCCGKQSVVQPSPFIKLYLGFIEKDSVISESCYKGTILKRNSRKMTLKWSFSYNSIVKFHGKKIGSHNQTYGQIHWKVFKYITVTLTDQ